jgi:para-aminobenzoate synthetase/4-amino-4-deoxychorismate lyase
MFVLLDDQVTHRQRVFRDPHRVITYCMGDPLTPLFDQIDAAQAEGHWLAGIFHYEFGAALEPKLAHIVKPGTEIVRLGVFDAPGDHPPANWLYRDAPPAVSLAPVWTQADYRARFEKVQAFLRAGDAYQINLTFPMMGTTDADALALYAGYRRRQPGHFGAVVSLGGPEVISFSPELFFARDGQGVRMRPMKGTRAKGAAGDMRVDEKSRAENLMIVDLLRNDLSRLCDPGSVRVPDLFTLEDYPTLTQMTSTVTGQLRTPIEWLDIFRALFPCGSVTGAPKIRAMEIIHDLEAGPRGPYCGAIGYIAPDNTSAFSVAIRTATLDAGQLRYDVGSGVVLDSDGADEYAECLLKASLLERPQEAAIETMRWEPGQGIVRLEAHAERFYAARPNGSLHRAIDDLAETASARVRIAAAPDGVTQRSVEPLDALDALDEPVPIALSRYALSPTVQRTDFKTSYRDFYDGERARIKTLTGAEEVVFLGEDGLLKEGSFTSIFLRTDPEGPLLTPAGPGLLPGVLRAELLQTGAAVEAELRWADLLAAQTVFIGNSLRGLRRATPISQISQ